MRLILYPHNLLPQDVVAIGPHSYIVQTVGPSLQSVTVCFTNGQSHTYRLNHTFVVFRRQHPCLSCDGTGWTCHTCGNKGSHCFCEHETQDAMDCQNCQGTGEDDV